MNRYSITYKDHNIPDSFLRGCIIEEKSFEKCLKAFARDYDNCEIIGILKSKLI